ncbi:MAG: hypothetical protein IPL53_19395 [Ignavibacteria bacterium]|nr:hypothetical protein [Ignavibacteria bacterium]
MNITFLSISFLLLISSISPAQTKISSIEITGNSYLSNSDISNLMISKKEGIFSEEQFKTDLKNIRDRYKSSGYLFAKFAEEEIKFDEDSSFVEIVLRIDEGSKVLIGDIEVHGNKTLSPDQLLKNFETKEGDIFSDNKFNNDIKDLLTSYEELGLPFAKVNINEISVYKDGSTEKIKVDFKITENSKVKIDQIKIRGNELTEDYVILREMKFDKSKIVNSESLQQMKERLDRLNIFRKHFRSKIYSIKSTNESGLLIEVTEGNTNTFDGIIGYVPPDEANGGGYFTGMVNVSFRNLFGTGRKIEANYQQEVQATQELAFKYFEPYFLIIL